MSTQTWTRQTPSNEGMGIKDLKKGDYHNYGQYGDAVVVRIQTGDAIINAVSLRSGQSIQVSAGEYLQVTTPAKGPGATLQITPD
jgi:hypothetical protein